MQVSEELVRKRCEHNEGEIHSLEELSLHQLDVERLASQTNRYLGRQQMFTSELLTFILLQLKN